MTSSSGCLRVNGLAEMEVRQQSAIVGYLAGYIEFMKSNKTAHTRFFQIRLDERHRVKAHRRGLRDLSKEELLRGLEWDTDVGSKSPRAKIRLCHNIQQL